MNGQVTVVVAVAAGGELKAGLAGPDSRGSRPRPWTLGRNRRPPPVKGHPVCPS